MLHVTLVDPRTAFDVRVAVCSPPHIVLTALDGPSHFKENRGLVVCEIVTNTVVSLHKGETISKSDSSSHVLVCSRSYLSQS